MSALLLEKKIYLFLRSPAARFFFMGATPPNPHSPTAGHLFLFNIGRWPAAAEWVYEEKYSSYRNRSPHTVTVVRSWTENK